MIARGRGAVVNVASLLALSGPLRLPMAGRATYTGAKSFLLTFTQLLAGELEGSGVHAIVCLPGMVESEFHGIGGGRFAGVPLMTAEDVAQAIVVGLELGRWCAPRLSRTRPYSRDCASCSRRPSQRRARRSSQRDTGVSTSSNVYEGDVSYWVGDLLVAALPQAPRLCRGDRRRPIERRHLSTGQLSVGSARAGYE